MQFMLKVPFEQFLAKLLCQFIDDNYEQNSKFHFESADPQRATKLYNAFRDYADKMLSVDISGTPINAITTDKNHRILIMLHRDGEQGIDTYNEDFIANVRDELNKLDNTNLVVIHNSSLDTILTSFQNLNAKGQIFTPESIKEALINLIVSHDHPPIMQILLSYRERKIVEENLSIFAYEYLYNSIINNTVDFANEGLFRDPRLFTLTNKKEIEGDIKDNSFLYNVIDRYVTDFSNSEVELKEKLEEIGLGEKFIKEYFFDRDQPLKWQELEYRYLVYEIDKNKHRLLDVENIEYNGKTLTTYKHGADTGAKYKKISVIIETDSADVELKIRMTKGAPLLTSDQIRVYGDYCKNQINLRAANHEKQTTLTASFTFDGNPKFFKIQFARLSVKENFQFNILVVKKATFNFHRYFEKVTIDFERNKGKVLLENIVEPISISAKNTIEQFVKQVDEIINFEIVGILNLQQILENEVSTTLTFLHNNIQLPVSVTGSITLDSIKLPSILDAQRSMTIFEAERIPRYNAKTKRVIIAGKEKALNVDAQILCSIEYEIVHQGLLTWHENQEPKLIQNLATCYPAVTLAYQDLFAWLKKNETILSITNWSADLRKCVHSVVQAVIDALEQIPNGSLTSEQRELLEIGIYKGTMNKQEGSYEWFTPYHPLCLSYALELANKLSTTHDQSISEIPSTTLNKLTPAGLLPILVDDKQEYSFTEAHSHNKLWLKIIPQKQNNPSFVKGLVSEKIKDFTSCFDMLFKQNEYTPLLINSIHNQDNEFIFKGIVDYLEKDKNKSKYIHVNIFDDNLYYTFFDQFSESRDINQLRNIIKLSPKKQDITDELIALIREKVSYSKFINKTDYAYAHLSFFKNNEKVKVTDRPIGDAKTGVTCQGFISGEASSSENNNYYTSFGLKALQEKNNLIQLAKKYNELLIPYKDKSASYIENKVPALVVHDQFKEKLTRSYDNSIWTCIIDPKVTLDFFDDANTILIHYSDHYTNSSSYDAITVSSRVSLYKSLLNKESDELLNSFNAISGQWLLEIVKASGKKNSDATTKQIKEKQGIIAAYKFLASFLLKSDITWVPLPIAELIRVTGSLGLGVKDNDFSARLHNKQLGAMCDDLLFVGFDENDVFLLPLEVKNREKGTDFTKAVEQAKELGKFMKELLASPTFKGQIYRSLFIQHVISQIERFDLYNVFPADYFDSIKLSRGKYQQGNYQISEIKNYPLGIALALNNNRETARLTVILDESSNILKIELPLGLSEHLQSQTIANLADELTNKIQYPELKDYILTDYKSSPFNINNSSELKTATTTIEQRNSEKFTITDEIDIETQTEFQIPTVQEIDKVQIPSNFVKNTRVLLGKSIETGENIYWEYSNEKLSNRHLIIFGRSGQGKTYCIQGILMELAKDNHNSLIIDYTNGFLPNQLESEFDKFIQPTSHYLAQKPLGISPFRKQKQDYGGVVLEEQNHIVANRIASVFNQVYSSIGEQQFATLANTIENGLNQYGSDYDFPHLYQDLIDSEKRGEVLANKLSPMMKSNLFDSSKDQGWENIFSNEQSRTTIIQLASLSRDIMQLATEFSLWDLYAYACSYGNKNKPLPIVLDEVQNLDHKLDSPLGKMLTEGRKYGISLILATQTLSVLKNEEQDRLFQAAHKLFFAPAETESMSYAKLLEQAIPGTDRKVWLKELANLQKGECISVGLHQDRHGNITTSAKTIKVANLESRLL